jgi:cephalosporin-C deacetylase-like acetyl esterase
MKFQYSFFNKQKIFGITFFFFIIGFSVKAQKEFDGQHGTQNWIGFSDAPNALYHHIANKIAAIHSLSGWQQRQNWIKKTLQEVVGTFPQKTSVNATITKTINKDGYHLENIIYESQPGYYVTSTLFIPNNLKNGKAPAIVYCSGHSDNGYRPNGYQMEILNLVKKGFIVFAFDPIGQGERLQYYNAKTNKSSFKWPAFEHSYIGAQLFLTGNTLASNFIWDGIRAVDYLLSRKEVDANRIGITGRSGGGTQSAYIAAMDERIKASAPENYITNFKWLYEAMGPQDAEQIFFYGIAKGLDMADLLEVRAPKPTLVITTSQDMFPIQGAIETVNEVTKIYKAYNQPGNFSMVSDDAPHASTKKNREACYDFFQKALNNPGDANEEEVKFLSAEELQVTKTGQVSTALNSASAYSLNYNDAEKKMKQLETVRKNYPAQFPNILRSAKRLSGYIEPKENIAPVFAGRIQRQGYVIEKYLLKGEGNYIIPYLLLKPETPNGKALLYLNPLGKSADAEVNGNMEWFVKKGITVLAPDIIGTGEMGPGEFKGDSYIDSVSYNIWFAAILNGRSIVGIQASDVVRLANQLKKDKSIHEIFGLAKKQMSPILLHAAAFDTDISKVALIEPYSSFRSIAMNPMYRPYFLHSTVAGSVGVYDLPDLAASLAPKKLLLIGVTDGNGNSNNAIDIDKDISVIRTAYQSNAKDKLKVVPLAPMEKLAEIFEHWLE